MSTACPAGHVIKSSADRDRQGYCRQCRREAERERRLADRAALNVVKIFEAAGVRFQNHGVPVDADEVVRQLVANYFDGAPFTVTY